MRAQFLGNKDRSATATNFRCSKNGGAKNKAPCKGVEEKDLGQGIIYAKLMININACGLFLV